MDMEGFITLHRKFMEWEWYRNPATKDLFLHCLFKANWKQKRWEGKIIERGQFITGIFVLSAETGLSVQQVRTALEKLQYTGEITRESTNGYTLITVCKYDTYQDEKGDGNKRTANEQQTDNKRSTNEQPPLTNTNNINKENKIQAVSPPEAGKKDILDDLVPSEGSLASVTSFEAFWSQYGKKTGKDRAFTFWGKLTSSERQSVLNYLPAYKLSTPDLKYRKNPDNFLQHRTWEEEIIPCKPVVTDQKAISEMRKNPPQNHTITDDWK
ncbi:MAG: hypothetical protein ACLQQ4_06500 [Bacteroidia bacterium]